MDEKERRAALREQYKNRHPDMGIVCWKVGDIRWIGISRDIAATYNSTNFQLELGSWPKKDLQKAYSANPAAAEWLVLKQLDYEDPAEDYMDDLELLLMEVQDEYPDARKLSTRKFC